MTSDGNQQDQDDMSEERASLLAEIKKQYLSLTPGQLRSLTYRIVTVLHELFQIYRAVVLEGRPNTTTVDLFQSAPCEFVNWLWVSRNQPDMPRVLDTIAARVKLTDPNERRLILTSLFLSKDALGRTVVAYWPLISIAAHNQAKVRDIVLMVDLVFENGEHGQIRMQTDHLDPNADPSVPHLLNESWVAFFIDQLATSACSILVAEGIHSLARLQPGTERRMVQDDDGEFTRDPRP